MKKIILLLNLFMAGFTFAQTSLTQTENYIYEKTCLTEDCSKKTESVQYLDGLGRARQTIAIKATPSGKDIAVPIEYDAYGRQVKSYLPVPQSGTQNGALYTNPLSNAASIYGNEKIYAEKVLESSPLGRPQQQKQVGNDWAGHPVQFSYDANTSADAVKKYTVVTSWPEGRTNSELSLSGTYAENTLYKSTVTDEDGNITTQFKNKKGQTILTRKKDGTQNADTYYVYNEYGGLAYTLPPLASASALTPAMVDNLCYQYRYDGWNRLVEKKIPGKGWEFMVYDKQNRLVLAQDTNLRTTTNNFAAKGWMFTKYDQFGRVAYTGFFANTATRTAMQTALNNMSANEANNEARSTTSFASGGMDVYYTKSAFPTGSMKVVSINYYDTYPSYSFNPAFPSAIMGKTLLSDNSTANAVSTKSLPVMSLVKNIEDDNWTKNYVYYDSNGRAIGSHSINHLGGYSKTESELDFIGVPQKSNVYHVRKPGEAGVTIKQRYVYDSGNRLLQHYHQVDDKPEELLSENTYNELSQITSKKVGNNLQSIDYSYSIRGQLARINDPANLGNDLFGYEIKYTNPGSGIYPGKYNGNIAEVDWKTATDGQRRRYNYSYDNLNRLQHAVYSKPDASVVQTSAYNEWMQYDLNGNIVRLDRYGESDGNSPIQIDQLNYSYSGNRLTSVTDASQNMSGYPLGSSPITYDDNGNMTSQPDKGISSISYNFLNLPKLIASPQGNTSYIYRADGTKVKKVFGTKATDYLDGFQYDNGILKFFPTSEGFYNAERNEYVYNYTDHLGNIRLSYTAAKGGGIALLEENNYYPFGMKHKGYNAGSLLAEFGTGYYHKYNGKEVQETGMLDYGWRQYIPELGRWNGIDQLAESYLSTSPFAYVANNPVSSFDVDGRWFNDDGSIGQAPPTWQLHGSQYKPTMSFSTSDGMHGGGGSYTPFGRTQAYADLMTAFYNGGTGGMSNIGGTLRWWTDYEDPDPTVTGIGTLGMLKLKSSYEYDTDMHKTSQTLRTWSGYAFSANKFVFQPAADRAVLYGAGEAYSTTNLVFEKALPKILGSRRIYVPLMEVSVKNAQRLAVGTKVAGRVLGGAGLILAGVDMGQNGVNMSNSLDLVMSVLAVSPTGWGQAIAGTYFLANGITTLVTGKDIGQHIEGAVNKYYNDGVRAEEQRKFNAAMGY